MKVSFQRALTLARITRKGGATMGPSPVNRGKPGAKHHLIVGGSGIPLAYSTTPGNRHDVSQLWPLLDRIPRDYLIHRRRRLATCYERRPDIHDALFGIGCILICWRHLERSVETNS
jgi:Transposase DDE domain